MDPVQTIVKYIEENDLWEKVLVLKRNEYLKINDSVDTNLYYIVEGSLRIFVLNQEEEQNIRFAYRNNFIASLDSFLSGKSSEFLIQAIKKTVVKRIGKPTFQFILAQREELNKLWVSILEQLILQQIEREKDLLISSPNERFRRVLERSPQLFQEIPNKYIANYLRMTPETLSRLKKS